MVLKSNVNVLNYMKKAHLISTLKYIVKFRSHLIVYHCHV